MGGLNARGCSAYAEKVEGGDKKDRNPFESRLWLHVVVKARVNLVEEREPLSLEPIALEFVQEVAMSSFAFYVAYDGPALELSEMPVRELAPALLAMADAFEEANRVVNQNRSEMRLNVKASFKTGCFGIDLVAVQNLKTTLLSFVSRETLATAGDIASLLGFGLAASPGVIWVIKQIKGRKINKIEVSDEKATIYVDDEKIETEKNVIELLRNKQIRDAIEEAVYAPLGKDGINSFAVTMPSPIEKLIEITKAEREYYKSPPVEEEIIEDGERETSYQVVGVSFQEGNKWRFSDGADTFYAEISDEDFLAQVDSKTVAFAKGDILKVKVFETLRLTKDGMKTDRKIIKVISHRHAVPQVRLPIVEAKGDNKKT